VSENEKKSEVMKLENKKTDDGSPPACEIIQDEVKMTPPFKFPSRKGIRISSKTNSQEGRDNIVKISNNFLSK
jgi:hypothetical protein